jgi:ABC-type multidrug transport system fused ATPase/permease subunit
MQAPSSYVRPFHALSRERQYHLCEPRHGCVSFADAALARPWVKGGVVLVPGLLLIIIIIVIVVVVIVVIVIVVVIVVILVVIVVVIAVVVIAVVVIAVVVIAVAQRRAATGRSNEDKRGQQHVRTRRSGGSLGGATTPSSSCIESLACLEPLEARAFLSCLSGARLWSKTHDYTSSLRKITAVALRAQSLQTE